MTYADLHYFPFFAGDWLAGEATKRMSPEQKGAYIDLLAIAWQSKEVACSLPNDDNALALMSGLGKKWRTVGLLVREQFQPVRGNETRLRNAKLWSVYQESVKRHRKRVAAGRLGGLERARQSSSNATASPKQTATNHNHNHSTTSSTPASRSFVPESAWAALDAVMATAALPGKADASIASIAAGAPNLKPTAEQMGRAVQDFAANGGTWNAAHFRTYVQRAIREDLPRPAFAGKPNRTGPRVYDYTEEPA